MCTFCPSGGGIGNQTLGQLWTFKFENWKDASERFSAHEKCLYHHHSVEVVLNACKVSSGKRISIDLQLNSDGKRQIEQNRKKLVPIIETIFLCGRQGLALRGHRDAGRILLEEDPTENEGNFRALCASAAKQMRCLKRHWKKVLEMRNIQAPKFKTR